MDNVLGKLVIDEVALVDVMQTSFGHDEGDVLLWELGSASQDQSEFVEDARKWLLVSPSQD